MTDADFLSELEGKILRALSPKAVDEAGYNRLEIDGYAKEAVSAAVGRLLRRGYVNAAFSEAAFGDNPAHFAPSSLTAQGAYALKQLG